MFKNFLAVSNINRDFQRPTEQEISDVVAVIRQTYPQITDQIHELTNHQRFYDTHIAESEKKSQKQVKHLTQMASIIGK